MSEIIAKQNSEAQALAREAMWIQQEILERGNPVRVYEGMSFERVK
jgi:peptide chain release factor